MQNKIENNLIDKQEKIALSRSKVFFYIFSALVFIFVVFYFSEITKDIKLFAQIKVFWLVIALLAQVCTYLSATLVYKVLLNITKDKPNIHFADLLRASVVSLFVSQTIPSGGISGNVFINNFIQRRGVSKQNAFQFVLIELLTFYFGVAIVIASVFFIYLFKGGMPVIFIFALFVGLFAHAILATLVGLLGNKKVANLILRKLSYIPFLRNKIKVFTTAIFDGLENPWKIFNKHSSVMAQAISFQICIFLFDSFTLYALFHGLGVPVSFLVAFISLVLTKSISSVPISPGALLIYEGSMTFFFVTLGVPLATAAIVTLMFRVLSFWLPMPIGLYFYKKLHKI